MAKEIKKEVEEVVVEESAAKKEFQKLIEIYKKQNPTKYELKKASFEKRLAAL